MNLWPAYSTVVFPTEIQERLLVVCSNKEARKRLAQRHSRNSWDVRGQMTASLRHRQSSPAI